MAREDKRAERLRDERVKRWYDNLANGSPQTADVRLRRLWRFCEEIGMSPSEYADLAKSGDEGLTRAEDILQDFVTKAQKDGLEGSYIAGIKKAVVSWLKFNYTNLWRSIKVKNSRGQYEGPVPSPEELRSILAKADLRAKVSISLVSFSSLRIETLGSGGDGLRISDLPEIKVQGGRVEFTRLPCIVKVRAELSKTGRPYFTFLCEEGAIHLRRYLEERTARSEDLTGGSPVIRVAAGKELAGFRRDFSNLFVTPKAVAAEIRTVMRPKYRFRPYDLRSYFEMGALRGESRYKTPRDYRQFMMGHTGDIEAQYSLNRGHLSEEVVEDMRSAYSKYAEFLSTEVLYIQGEQLTKIPKLEAENRELRRRVRSLETAILLPQDIDDTWESAIRRIAKLEKKTSMLDKLDAEEVGPSAVEAELKKRGVLKD